MRAWTGNAGLVLISILVALALVEAGLRATDFSYPSLYITDKITGSSLRPGVEGWYREEGKAYIKINTDGWRDRLHAKQKPANTKRIAILGDSYAEALQISEEDTFWRVLEQRLNACRPFGNMAVEAMNFGISGYGTAQELLLLRNRIWTYAPDIVLLAFVTGNDVRDNSKRLSSIYPRPYFKYENGSLELDREYVHSLIFKAKNSWAWRLLQEGSDSFKLLQLTNLSLNRFNQMWTWARYQQKGGDLPEPGVDDEVYLEPKTSDWEEAWRVSEALLVQMQDEVNARGAQFLVVTLSNSIQVHPNPAVRKRFAQKLGVSDLFYPERRLRALAEHEHIELITLGPILQAFAEENNVYLHGLRRGQLGRGHWNEEGHKKAGGIIARHFCSIAS
jgi:hypothetical protein